MGYLTTRKGPIRVLDRWLAKLGGNRAVLALSLARMADALGNSMIIIVIPLYVAEVANPLFGLPTPVLVGLLISSFGIVTSLAQPVAGAVSDWVGRRKPFIQIGLVLMTLGSLAFILAGQYIDVLAIRAVQGIGVALTVSASVSLMALITEKATRGGAMGIFTTLRMVGFALGPLVGGLLHVQMGFNAVFVVGAALIGLSTLVVQIWVHDVRVEENEADRGAFRLVDRELWTPAFMALGFATFLMAASFSMMTTLENEFNARLNQTTVGFSIAFSALVISRLLLQVPFGRLSDRIGRKPLILAGLALMAPATALLGAVVSTFQLTGLRLLQGVAAAAIAAPAFAVAADMSSAGGEGRQMTIITMGFTAGLALGPLSAGVLAVVFFQLPFFVAGALTLVGIGIVHRFVPETVQRTPDVGSGSPDAEWID
mgnify:CR=1 FL=1